MGAMGLSPRISFSQDMDQQLSSSPHDHESHRLDRSLMDVGDDFDFRISYDFSLGDPSPADELFSQGMLLPLSSSTISLHKAPPPLPETKRISTSTSTSTAPKDNIQKAQQKTSFWNMGRSSSVGAGRSTLASICPKFPRSKSAGMSASYNNQMQRKSSAEISSNNNKKKINHYYSYSSSSSSSSSSSTSKNNCYYYSASSSSSSKRGGGSHSHGSGVRINPVINVPAPFIPRGGSCSSTSTSGGGGSSLFAYLLCNCRDKKNFNTDLDLTYSP